MHVKQLAVQLGKNLMAYLAPYHWRNATIFLIRKTIHDIKLEVVRKGVLLVFRVKLIIQKKADIFFLKELKQTKENNGRRH